MLTLYLQDTDENGHGSHVSGTIGGRTFGVAKRVNLVAVKVLDADGSGSNSGVIAGINFGKLPHFYTTHDNSTSSLTRNQSRKMSPQRASPARLS